MLTGFTSRLIAAAAAAIALSLVVSAQQAPPGARGNAAIRLKGDCWSAVPGNMLAVLNDRHQKNEQESRRWRGLVPE